MALIRSTVTCFRCVDTVPEANALRITTLNGQQQYECFRCYKYGRTGPVLTDKVAVKLEYYCERCRYKFKRAKACCPYCNKTDQISPANLTVHDLL